MFGIDSSEFLLIAVVALIVIGPKDLPRVMRLVGGWVGKGRAMTRHLRSGFDTMMREAELEEMQKQWAKQNAEIMAATAPAAVEPHAYDPVPAWDAPGHGLAGLAHPYDPAAEPHAFETAPAATDAVVGDAPVDHPGALAADEQVAADAQDRHPRESGDPSPDALREMGPRFRGDDSMGSDVATAMTGPQPSAHTLAYADTVAEPVAGAPPAHQAAETVVAPMPTAQP